MKKLIPLLILVIMASACDSPRSQRAILSGSTTNSATAGKSGTGTDLTPGTGGTTTTTPSNTPEDAKHCKFSTDGINGFETSSTHLGSYTLCKSSTDATVFYVQIKTPPVGRNGDVNVCFIPHVTSGSNSVYVGNPMCSNFTDPKQIKKITFVKYAAYTNAIINSVLFFKDTKYYYPKYASEVDTLVAYKDCLARIAAPYYDATFCTSFKEVAQYVLKSF